MNTYPQFGELLNQRLLKLDRSPAWLARRLQVKASTVSRWLNDGARPGSPEVVAHIADALGMAGEREKLLVAAGYGYQESHQVVDQERPGRVEGQSLASILGTETSLARSKSQGPRSNLPQPFTPFVGRDAEVAQLTGQLLNPMCRLLTLIGPGGIGKTRLAIEVARQLRDHSTNFTDGVYFISMAEHDSADQLTLAMVDVLELGFGDGGEFQSQLLGYLHNKQMLFVLDNFEHRLDAVDRVAQLLLAAPNVHVLATSRERLHLVGEHIFPVGGLDYDDFDDAAGEVTTSAIQLFVQSARYALFDFELTQEGVAQVQQICRQVEGMPLGIELAASWIELLSPAEISAEIQRSLDILARGQPSLHGAHQSMRAVFDSTWRRLDSMEQEVFARLACFQGSFTREAAEVVAGASLPLLSALVSKSLVQYRRDHKRYSLHALLCQFAEEKLRANEQMAEETYERHASYYSDLVHRQTDRLKGREHPAAMSEIEAEIENIRVAWQWACANRNFDCIDRCQETLSIFYMTKGWYQEGLATFEAAAHALHMDEPTGHQGIVLANALTLQAWMLTNVEWFIEGEDRKDTAYALLQKSLGIYDGLNGHAESGLVYLILGVLASQIGDDVKALQHCQQALEIFTKVQDQWKMGDVLRHMSYFCYVLGHFPQAFEYARQAIAIGEASGELSTLGMSLFRLGDALRASGNYAEAKIVGEKFLALSRATSNKWGVAWAAQLLGEVAWHTGDYVAAHEYADVSEGYIQALGLTRFIVTARVLQGNIACSLGDHARARSLIYPVLGSYLKTNTLNRHWGSAEALLGMVNVLLKEEKIQQAIEVLTHVLHHPFAWHETKARAADRLTELGQQCPAQWVLPQRSITVVVEELLSEPIAP